MIFSFIVFVSERGTTKFSVRNYDTKAQTIAHGMAQITHQVVTWANTSIIRQIFPHHFEESMQVSVIISYIITKKQKNLFSRKYSAVELQMIQSLIAVSDVIDLDIGINSTTHFHRDKYVIIALGSMET